MRVAKRTSLSLRLVWTLTAAAVMAGLPGFLSSCASSSTSNEVSSGTVITLNKIDTLRSTFNRDDGDTRLILIFSPT